MDEKMRVYSYRDRRSERRDCYPRAARDETTGIRCPTGRVKDTVMMHREEKRKLHTLVADLLQATCRVKLTQTPTF